MFGIGLGELALILFLLFIISPKDLPKLLKKAGRFLREINTLKDEITHTGNSSRTEKRVKSADEEARSAKKQKGKKS
jgi:Sec-independent protein translocase protein TatA